MGEIIIADIGGSKTLISVFDANDNKLETLLCKGAGLPFDSGNIEEFPELSSLLEEVSAKYNVSSVSVNLGGRNKGQIKSIFKKYFSNAVLSIHREIEGTASLKLGEKFNSELVILAGTGVVATATDKKGKFVVAGGWGCNISDAGSGYYIGLEAIKHSLKELDGIGELSLLTKGITGFERPFSAMDKVTDFSVVRDNLMKKIAPLDRRKVAAYTRIVAECCETGDDASKKILQQAGNEIAKLAVDTVLKLDTKDIDGITVTGGLVNIRQFWQTAFEEYVSRYIRVKEFHYVKDGVMLGIYEIAKQQIKIQK